MAAHVISFKEWMQSSYLGSGNEAYLESLYETYLESPELLDPAWKLYFDKLAALKPGDDVSHAAVQEQFIALGREKTKAAPSHIESADPKLLKVMALIMSYRRLGHLQAKIDPLHFYKGVDSPNLHLDYHGLSEADLDTSIRVNSTFSSVAGETPTLRHVYERLRQIYCGSIGFEYMHINRTEEVEWIRTRIEGGYTQFQLSDDEKKRLLENLVKADGLEKYLGVKYVGQKRFSLEGGDGLIPMLDNIVNRATGLGVQDIVIGMAHRGRLNVLVNVVGKDPKDIFAAFEGKGVSDTHSGDVKYHLGASSDVETPNGPIHLTLAFNPSHLEIISPVVQGSVRARQRRRRDSGQAQVLPIQIHGDAAFAGQGVVMETFNMSKARWFTVGGSIHIVVNNQVGFTISNPQDARSTLYCTDVAKMVEAPILHVNANDAEAVVFAALFAMDYRQTFKRDVVIDLVCYRRHGHNEADEPSATQPLMYKAIKAMKPAYQLYARKLQNEGVIDEDYEQKLALNYRDQLDQGKIVVQLAEEKVKGAYAYSSNWRPFEKTDWVPKVDTTVPLAKLQSLCKDLMVLPDGFVVQPQVKKTIDAQVKMADGSQPMNWGFAEMLAFATLLDEGYPIRLCGQDAARGTFAHRHAVLHDQNTDDVYIRLSHLTNQKAQINIVDSLLSEEAVLAFEYGYATTEPNNLVIWEAQFGDFANGAQVVIDQFISSGEQKWTRMNALILLLPHGYEGQGPEHSSARLERYLQLCAQNNMQVCMLTTPAQIFHALRRQLKAPYRKPLIVMSPKSLLRHPLAISTFKDLTDASFQFVIPETASLDPAKIERVIFCSGKVYYDLLQHREENKITDTAIIRVEQLYPFPKDDCIQVLKTVAHAKTIVWCQEESENQGAWPFMEPQFRTMIGKGQTLRYVGRAASASPAVGYHSVHEHQQELLVTNAFTN